MVVAGFVYLFHLTIYLINPSYFHIAVSSKLRRKVERFLMSNRAGEPPSASPPCHLAYRISSTFAQVKASQVPPSVGVGCTGGALPQYCPCNNDVPGILAYKISHWTAAASRVPPELGTSLQVPSSGKETLPIRARNNGVMLWFLMACQSCSIPPEWECGNQNVLPISIIKQRRKQPRIHRTHQFGPIETHLTENTGWVLQNLVNRTPSK